MLTLIQIELYKIFKKWRTYIGFMAIGVLVPIIHTAMVFEGKDTLNFMTRNIQDSFVFVGNLLNGYLVSYLILTSLAVHIPFLIALVAGDLLAGEIPPRAVGWRDWQAGGHHQANDCGYSRADALEYQQHHRD